MKLKAKIEFGDFQTPAALAKEICGLLRRQRVVPEFVLEPTCGTGAFLVAAAETFPCAALRGCDINPDYVQQAAAELAHIGAALRATVGCQDFLRTTGNQSCNNCPACCSFLAISRG